MVALPLFKPRTHQFKVMFKVKFFLKFKSCNLHFSWNSDLNFNIRDIEFSLYSFNLFKVTSSSNDAISTAFIAISNSYDEISTWIV